MRISASSDAPKFRLKLRPLLIALGLTVFVVFGSGMLCVLSARLFHTALPQQSLVQWLYLQHSVQLALGLAAIAVLKFGFLRADFGLHWPRGRTYIGWALLGGVVFGVLMTVVDYGPQLVARRFAHADWPPGYPVGHGDVWRWMLFSAYAGPTEEIPFRALLVTYLAATMPGTLRVGRFQVSWAGVIVAIIFALLHASSFFNVDWALALGQQVYAFVFSIVYAYWLEKSRSVVASMVGHGLSDLVENVIVFACMGLL